MLLLFAPLAVEGCPPVRVAELQANDRAAAAVLCQGVHVAEPNRKRGDTGRKGLGVRVSPYP